MAVRDGTFGHLRPSIFEKLLWRAIIVALIIIGILLVRDHRWQVILDAGPFLLRGLKVSWLLTFASVGLGLPISIFLALLRLNGPPIIKQLAVGTIEVVRATPQLMLIFWVFFAVPAITGNKVPAWTAAIVSLTLIAAAYLAEVVRAGILSVPKIQIESGIATGLTRFQIVVYVVLPQAFRNMVPALIATIVLMFKITSLIYVVGITDFFRAVILVNNREFEPVALYTTLATGYFICCYALSWTVYRIDAKRAAGN